jgi:protein-tyrosine phosphatase
MKILMVCLGNICRSPIAEGVMQQLIDQHQLDWQVDSAGTNGLHTGEPPHKHSTAVCKQHGIDISHQISAKFTRADFDHYDIIYAMANDVYNNILLCANNHTQMQKVQLFLDELYPNQNKDVTDPWYGGPEGYLPVYLQIQDCCKAIVDKYKNYK